MTFLGKFLVFVNTFIAVALLSWSLSLYTNQIDYAALQDQDRKLSERLSDLSQSIQVAQSSYADSLQLISQAEARLENQRRLISVRQNEAQNGQFYELFRDLPANAPQAGANELIRTSRLDLSNNASPILGIDGKPLRGIAALQRDLDTEVRLSQEQSEKLAMINQSQLAVHTEVADLNIQLGNLKKILTNLEQERLYLGDRTVDWMEQYLTLQQRNEQLKERLAQLQSNPNEPKIVGQVLPPSGFGATPTITVPVNTKK